MRVFWDIHLVVLDMKIIMIKTDGNFQVKPRVPLRTQRPPVAPNCAARLNRFSRSHLPLAKSDVVGFIPPTPAHFMIARKKKNQKKFSLFKVPGPGVIPAQMKKKNNGTNFV